MFTVRREHMDAFDKDIARRFENRTVEHLNQYFPQECSKLGEDGVRDWIRHGVERAGRYGIVAERDVCRYIDIMFVYGRNFDTDARYPWAHRTLNTKAVHPTHKTDQLAEAAQTNLHTRGM